MTEVWKIDMTPSDKMVLLALADAANDQGVTWMAVRHRKAGDDRLDLLTKCSLSERAVQGALKRLVDGGHLTRKDVPGKGVIWTVHPRSICAPQDLRPAGNDMNPRSICGETVSNHHLSSEAKASSEGARTNAKSPKPRATRRCPDDWSPKPETTATLAGEGYDPGTLERALAMVRDHEFRTPRSDWDATYRNWVRNEPPPKAPNDRSHPRHPSAREDRLGRMLAGAERAVGA